MAATHRSPMSLPPSLSLLLLRTVALLLLLLLLATPRTSATVPPGEVKALNSLFPIMKPSRSPPTWVPNTDPCDRGWENLLCNDLNTSVTHLSISSDILDGTIPTELLIGLPSLEALYIASPECGGEFLGTPQEQAPGPGVLHGPIPPEIAKLSKLKELVFCDNALEGPIPSEVSQLVRLELLVLQGTRLSGPIPSNLGGLSKLQGLDLSKNNFTGPIPSTLFGLSQLKLLDLSENQLSGGIPPELGQMSNLSVLALGKNQFTGALPPQLAMMQSLEVLACPSLGSISGSIPPVYGILPKLRVLDLSRNGLSGELPAELGRLELLQELDVEGNALTGRLPDGLSKLRSLKALSLDNNRFFGPLPESSFPVLSSLAKVTLSNNLFTGPLPDMGGVETVDVQNNYFTGNLSSVKSTMRLGFNCLGTEVADQRAKEACSAFYSCIADKEPNGTESIQLCAGANANVMISQSTRRRANQNILVKVLIPILIVGLLAVTIAAVILWRRSLSSRWNTYGGLQEFSYQMLKEATNNFSEYHRLGGGGSSTVFRGVIADRVVAVKRLKKQEARKSSTSEFLREVRALGELRHVNLVNLLGFSCEPGRPLLLVYEFVAGGTLRSLLHHGKKTGRSLSFPARMRVALGIARGIEYCHHLLDEPLIHRDIKSDNILMTSADEEGVPKVADFGLAKIMGTGYTGSKRLEPSPSGICSLEREAPPDHPRSGKNYAHSGPDIEDPNLQSQEHPSKRTTGIVGTLGYIDPQYYFSGRPTLKSDVFSFGMVLLELTLVVRALKIHELAEGHISSWVGEILQGGQEDVRVLVETMSKQKVTDGEGCHRVLRTAYACLQEDGADRPTMHEVVRMLECRPTDFSPQKDAPKISGGAPTTHFPKNPSPFVPYWEEALATEGRASTSCELHSSQETEFSSSRNSQSNSLYTEASPMPSAASVWVERENRHRRIPIVHGYSRTIA